MFSIKSIIIMSIKLVTLLPNSEIKHNVVGCRRVTCLDGMNEVAMLQVDNRNHGTTKMILSGGLSRLIHFSMT